MREKVLDQPATKIRQRRNGIALSLESQVLWGTAGNVIQYLFLTTTITVAWIVGFRLIVAGVDIVNCYLA